MDVAGVKAALNERAEAVCAKLYPQGKKNGHNWLVGSVDGSKGKSFSICVSGSKVGVFTDFAGDKGGANLLELWIQATGTDFKTALEQAKQFLGVRDEPPVKSQAKKTYQKPKREGFGVAKTKTVEYLESRGITKETIDLYKICESKDKASIVFPYLSESGELEMVKHLNFERDDTGKKVIRTNAAPKKVLFGMHTVDGNAREIAVSEGELDSLTWRQATGIPCVSVPFGAKHDAADGSNPNDEWIELCWPFLERFEKIYLAFDMDEEGKKARESIARRLGRERCFVVDTPEKDANATLTTRGPQALVAALERARTLDPTELRNAADFYDALKDRYFGNRQTILNGLPMPFYANSGQFNIRLRELTVVQGYANSGKTQWLNYLLTYLIGAGKKCMDGSFEVRADETMTHLISQVSGCEKPVDEIHLQACVQWIGSGLWFYDLVGTVEWKDLLSAMKYAYKRYGVVYFALDSMAKLTKEKDDYNAQKAIISDLTTFVDEFPSHVFLVAHSKVKDDYKGKAGDLIAPRMNDIEGAKEIIKLPHNILRVFRNKSKEIKMRSLLLERATAPDSAQAKLEIEIASLDATEHDALVSVQKQRKTGSEPDYYLWYDPVSRQYSNARQDSPETAVPPDETTDIYDND